MADIYFYQVQCFMSNKNMCYSKNWSVITVSVTQALQQCDPEDETDGGGTLGDTNTQVHRNWNELETEIIIKSVLNALVLVSGRWWTQSNC